MPRIPRQEKLEGRHFLRDFVTDALSTLASDAYVDEVVHLAGDVVELEFDAKTRPETIHPLPEGYEYHFSGWWGMYLGVRRVGDWVDH